jgi:hypothetical protein
VIPNLRRRRIGHPVYFPDFVICDFDLFGCLKDQLAVVTVVKANDFRNQKMSILAGISEDKKNRLFEHGIERFELIAEHEGNLGSQRKEFN